MIIDIFNIPLYYINFKQNSSLENHLKKIGFKNINHFNSIDGKKYKPEYLLENNIITIRTYNDLVYGREQSTGMPTLGGIGCTLSHRDLWKLCIDKNLPYIIIVENDAYFNKPLSNKDILNISSILKQPNGGFVSANFKNKAEYFFGAHFVILTNGCARELYKYSLPIDVQTDVYMNNINNREKINLEGYKIANQKFHKSTIQTTNCIKCFLPKSMWFYIIILLFIIFMIILYISTKKNLRITRVELENCTSSRSFG